MLTQPGNVDDLLNLALVELARATVPSALLACQKDVEKLVAERLPARGAVPIPGNAWRFPNGGVLHLAHFGAMTGSNAWSDVGTVIVAGRPSQNCHDGEWLAEVIAGRPVLRTSLEKGGWWPTVDAGIRLADGTGFRMKGQPRHPDPFVDDVRYSIAEANVLQAIGRLRGVRRTAANPVRVVLLARLALPLDVHEVVKWAELKPERLEVAVAEAELRLEALALSDAGLAAFRPDLWDTADAAKKDRQRGTRGHLLMRDTYKGMSPRSLDAARFRPAGSKNWCVGLAPSLSDGRAALEARLGTLAAYELVFPAPPPGMHAPPPRREAPPWRP